MEKKPLHLKVKLPKARRAVKAGIWRGKTGRMLLCLLIWVLAIGLGGFYIWWISAQQVKILPPDCPAKLRLINSKATDAFVSLTVNGLFSDKSTPITIINSTTRNRADVQTIMQNRAIIWHWLLGIFVSISILSSAIIHKIWRGKSRNIIRQSREAIHMKSSYYTCFCTVVMINLILALVLFLLSYAGTDFTIEQFSYNLIFLLSPLALVFSSRLAAPLSISGKGCFFH